MATVSRKNPKSFDKILEGLKGLDAISAKAGWFERSVYANGTPVAYIASIHEFGVASKNIPPRPFMRPTVNAQMGAWRTLLEQGSRSVLAGKSTPYDVMEKIGLRAAGDIAKTIANIWYPPLKESTVKARARKLSDGAITASLRKPLITPGPLGGKLFGELLNETLNHRVETK